MHCMRQVPQREKTDSCSNTADIESNNAHRQKGSAKTWDFPEAYSYINIVSSKRRDSFCPKLHRDTQREQKSFFLLRNCWTKLLPKIRRGEKHSHFSLILGMGTQKCDGAERDQAITDALAEALWKQICLVNGTCGSVQCLKDVLEYFKGGTLLSCSIFNA